MGGPIGGQMGGSRMGMPPPGPVGGMPFHNGSMAPMPQSGISHNYQGGNQIHLLFGFRQKQYY